MTTRYALFMLTMLALTPPSSRSSPVEVPQIDLSGPWTFALDRDDQGEARGWTAQPLGGTIQLPGSLQAQGFGDDVSLDADWTGQIVDRSYFDDPRYAPYRQPGNIKVPFWLQPEKVYVGPAWFSREVTIPGSWLGKRVVLSLERPHWVTTLWLDGRAVGRRDSLSTPHVYDLGTQLSPGPHRLTLRVDNRLATEVGINAHSVTDHTQTNWNGVVGRLTLTAVTPVQIQDLQIYPDVAARTLTIRGRIEGPVENASAHSVRLECRPAGQDQAEPLASATLSDLGLGPFEASLALAQAAPLWDEFRPNLLQVTATLDHGVPRTATFGLRHITTRGTQFTLNGRPISIRGTLECCIFPLTGYPPTDAASWERIIAICKAHGLNNMRFHSWCPPEAAFDAADRLGFYFQVECPAWVNAGPELGKGLAIDQWLDDETSRILSAYGNHPSFLLMSSGNEPSGPPTGDGAGYLVGWVERFKARDPRRLFTSASGWPQLAANQYHVTPDPRIQAWGGGLGSRINARPPETTTDYRDYIRARDVPVISHEIGEWCAYPDFDEIARYTGHIKARNFEIFRDFLDARHMGPQARDFLMASGRLQVLAYKEEIESALRTPGMGGFMLLDLHDFPGQGTALVGVLDPFWNSKPYCTPQEYRRFCGPIVPLVRLPARVFTTADTLQAPVELAHFGPDDLPDATLTWQLQTDAGTILAAGRLAAPASCTAGALHPFGSLEVPLRDAPAPCRARLTISLANTEIANDWDLWIYPEDRETPLPEGITLVRRLDETTLASLSRGGRVLLLAPPAAVAGQVQLGFSPVFWNSAWTKYQPPDTLGLLCDPQHPALARFPTSFHSDWQWWDLVHGGAAMVVDDLPPALRPMIQPIDTWFRAHRLAMLFEARVGGGKLLVCSMDLESELPRRPVARQMRDSLFHYLDSPAFDPQVEVSPDAIRALLRPDADHQEPSR